MNKVFLDANVLFSAAYKTQARLTELWTLHHIKLVTSDYATEEAMRNLNDVSQQQRLSKLTHSIEIITKYNDSLIPANIELNEKDRPILAATIAAHANFLITGDRDFLHLFGKKIHNVLILTPAEFFSQYSYP